MSTLSVAGATTTFNTMNTLTIERAIDQVQVLDFPVDIFSLVQQEATELTRAFIKFCQSVFQAKEESDRKSWREGRESLAWDKTTANPYVKVGEWITSIDSYNLELLDINTIKSLCCEKFKPILERLETERLTVVEVREEMKAINEATKKPKTPKPQLEWKQSQEGERKLTVNDIDEVTGTLLESRFKDSSESVLSFFIRRLLEGNSQPVVQVQEPLVDFDQLPKTDEVEEIKLKIQNCDRVIQKFADSTNASEVMVRRVAFEDKAMFEGQLNKLVIGIGARVQIVSNHFEAGCCGEIVGENGDSWKVLLDKHKQLEDAELHIPVHVNKELIRLI